MRPVRRHSFPDQLKLQLVAFAHPLVLDIEHRIGRDAQPLARHLNVKCLAGFDCIGEAAQFGRELGMRIGFSQVTLGHGMSFRLSDHATRF